MHDSVINRALKARTVRSAFACPEEVSSGSVEMHMVYVPTAQCVRLKVR